MKNLGEELEKIDADPGEVLEQIPQEGDQSGNELSDAPEGGAPEGGTPRTPKTPASEPLTPERIAEISANVADRMMQNQRSRQPRQEPQLTQEQVDRLLNPVRLTADHLKAFGIAEPTPEMVKGYQAFSDLLTKHHTSLFQVALEAQQRRMYDQAAPLFDHYQRAEQERQKAEFFGEYPKLARFGKVVQFAASQVQAVDERGNEKTIKAVKAEIAQIAKDLLKESGVDLDTLPDEDGGEANANHSAGPTKSNVPKMAGLGGSGRSGAPVAKGGGNNPDADIYN